MAFDAACDPHLFGSISRDFHRPSEESVNRAVEPLFGVTSSLEGPFASLGKTVLLSFNGLTFPATFQSRDTKGSPRIMMALYAIILVMLLC